MGGLFLFIPDLVRFEPGELAAVAKLPGSRMIPAAQALCASLERIVVWHPGSSFANRGDRVVACAGSRVG
jgi:hypothetical protein